MGDNTQFKEEYKQICEELAKLIRIKDYWRTMSEGEYEDKLTASEELNNAIESVCESCNVTENKAEQFKSYIYRYFNRSILSLECDIIFGIRQPGLSFNFYEDR